LTQLSTRLDFFCKTGDNIFPEIKAMSINGLIRASRELGEEASVLAKKGAAELRLKGIAYIYNPLDYALALHEQYIKKYGAGRKKALFLGMNPGPFGMAQTGVPFGDVSLVRDWMGISGEVGRPERMHPKRPIEGFACSRSEVSGRRFWGLMQERFGRAEVFFKDHWVDNYCPLVFMAESGANITPDKLPRDFKAELFVLCDKHLGRVINEVKPAYCIGIGAFTTGRFKAVLEDGEEENPRLSPAPQICTVLHPSPASPAANRGWAGAATEQLIRQGVWQ
jgi:single-strand selective monofunctional uracil DNA glycosylase